MIESEYIKKTDAMNIVKRTHGDYVAAWSEIRELPAVEIAKEKKLVASWKWDGNSWVCGNCKYPSIVLLTYGSDWDPYAFKDTAFCNYCGAKMRYRGSVRFRTLASWFRSMPRSLARFCAIVRSCASFLP